MQRWTIIAPCETGFPEVIFAQGKTEQQVIGIYKKLAENEANVLITRASPALFDALHASDNRLHYNALAKTVRLEEKPRERKGLVLVISAGTADLPVAEEAVETASLCGSKVEKYMMQVSPVFIVSLLMLIVFNRRVVLSQ